jgi:hypothetical protein
MASTLEKRQKQRTVKALDMDITLINKQAKTLGCSAADVIHTMCEDLRRQTYLQEVGETFDLMRANPEELAEFEAEQKLWDCTLSDGLDDAY